NGFVHASRALTRQALEQTKKALEIDPYFPRAHADIAACLEQKGKYQEAIAEADGLLARSAQAPDGADLKLFARFQLARLYARAGRRDDARRIVSEILKDSQIGGHFRHMWLAAISAALGENDQAIVWLQKAYETRAWGVFRAHVDPMFDSVWTDPRFT